MTPASLVSNRAPWQAGCDDAVCSVCTTQVFCGDSVLWHCPAHGLPVGWALSHPPLESLAALEAARAACQQGPGAPSVPVVQDDDNSSDERLMADFDTMQGPDAAVGPTEGDHADGGGDEADNEFVRSVLGPTVEPCGDDRCVVARHATVSGLDPKQTA